MPSRIVGPGFVFLKDKNADEIRIDLCTLSPNVGAPHHVPQVADYRGFVGDADLFIVAIAAFPEDSAGFVREEFVDKEAAVEKTWLFKTRSDDCCHDLWEEKRMMHCERD
jgi:hypothetical protein